MGSGSGAKSRLRRQKGHLIRWRPSLTSKLQQRPDVPGVDYATEPENGDFHDTKDDTEAQHRNNNSHNNGQRGDQRNNDHRHCDSNDVQRRRGEQQPSQGHRQQRAQHQRPPPLRRSRMMQPSRSREIPETFDRRPISSELQRWTTTMDQHQFDLFVSY